MHDTQVAVIGAGPHGLAAAAHLRRQGVEARVFGDPMSFWRSMPVGMLLRSSRTASSISEYDGPLSLDSYREATGRDLRSPIPLDDFVGYGMWVQGQAVPDVVLLLEGANELRALGTRGVPTAAHAIDGMATGIGQHHVGREVLAFGSQTVHQPRPERRPTQHAGDPAVEEEGEPRRRHPARGGRSRAERGRPSRR